MAGSAEKPLYGYPVLSSTTLNQATFFIERVERSMHGIIEYEWQDALQDAVHERDPREIEGRVLRAEIAIFERVHSPCRVDSIETQALFDALKVLRLLRSSAHRANIRRFLEP